MTAITDTDVQRAISMTRANFRLPELIPRVYRLLAEGKPVTVEHVATTGGRWKSCVPSWTGSPAPTGTIKAGLSGSGSLSVRHRIRSGSTAELCTLLRDGSPGTPDYSRTLGRGRIQVPDHRTAHSRGFL